MSDATSALNIDLVLRHYDEFLNKGDMSAAERDLRPDFVDHAAAPGTPPGIESSKAFISMVRSAFPDIRFTEEEVIANGDMVAVFGLWRGTHGGSFLGLEATGRYCEMRGMVLWRIVEGKLAERWAVLDYGALFEWIQGERQPSSLPSVGR
jgi:predicted ester cyclase